MSKREPDRAPVPAETPEQTDRPLRPTDDEEIVYFHGSPRLRGYAGRTLLLGLLGLACIAGAIAGWVMALGLPVWAGIGLIVIGLWFLLLPWLLTRATRFRITNYRVDFERGLLSKRLDTLELWHVDDISMHQSLFDRIMGVGTISIVSDDRTTPHLTIGGIPNPRKVFESLKQRIISVKRQRGVLKMDLG